MVKQRREDGSEGQHTTKRKKQELSENEDEAHVPMGKYLASTEKSVRDGAIRSLTRYLAQSQNEPLSEKEMAKLWKGIFYCFWMSDKPRVQQALAQELADIVLNIHVIPRASSSSDEEDNADTSLDFLQGFFDAMVREWSGLDKWRVDKFLLLVRRFVNAAFRLLQRESWRGHIVGRFAGMLTRTGGPLCANDAKVPDGLTYHIADIFLDEWERAVTGDTDKESKKVPIPVQQLVQPFVDTVATCRSSIVYDRIMHAVFEPLLEACLVVQREMKEGVQDSTSEYHAIVSGADGTPSQIRRQIFGSLFKAASLPSSNEARRRKLYRLYKAEEERREEEDEE